eukprot:m.484324 g.484324  ORF g.484324 m.484324 type:complete len:63 (-) comp21731_c2_seq1:472-660(-)
MNHSASAMEKNTTSCFYGAPCQCFPVCSGDVVLVVRVYTCCYADVVLQVVTQQDSRYRSDSG